MTRLEVTMNAPTAPIGDDEGMPAEIDFSGGVRGQFYKPDLRLVPQIQDTLLN